MAIGGLALAYDAQLLAAAGGGSEGVAQATVELLSTQSYGWAPNLVSFARLAAFGLTHAALGGIRLGGAPPSLWASGGVRALAAVLLFVVGNVADVRAGGRRRRRPGPAARVLRALLPRLRQPRAEPFRPWSPPRHPRSVRHDRLAARPSRRARRRARGPRRAAVAARRPPCAVFLAANVVLMRCRPRGARRRGERRPGGGDDGESSASRPPTPRHPPTGLPCSERPSRWRGRRSVPPSRSPTPVPRRSPR